MSIDRRQLLSGASALWLCRAPAFARDADPARVTIATFDVVRPSQGAVGMREVATKTADVRRRSGKPDKLARFLVKEALPVVKGPDGALHLVDHHHLGRALWDLGRPSVHVEHIADLSALPQPAFWSEMDRRGWLHAFDADGRPVEPERLPHHLKDMADDVYRSLAGAVRDAGGYGKTQTPFAEFKWADFLRARIDRALVARDYGRAVNQAIDLARTPQAAALPGFAGRQR